MILSRLFAAALFVSALAAPACADNLQAVAWQFSGFGCTGSDYYVNLSGRSAGSGTFPTVPVTIVGWQIKSFLPQPTDYVVVGHTAPWGDYLTNIVFGTTVRSRSQLGQDFIAGMVDTMTYFDELSRLQNAVDAFKDAQRAPLPRRGPFAYGGRR